MRLFIFSCLTTALFIGCSGQSSVKSVASGQYPALQELSMDTLMMVGPDASMGNWGAVKKAAASDKFREKVDHFTKSDIPGEIPDGTALKERTVKALENLITTARTNGGKPELEASWKELNDSIGHLNAAAEGRKQ